ncbi:MAG: Gfo/Idh/MocA family oxidoreductase [Verrucomicrobiales bacterium]|nr:Gfo/Idh/MocA family oxidoreductase [Verrucomicrobiales bacterium]
MHLRPRIVASVALTLAAIMTSLANAQQIRVGIIGLDTSHAEAFTKVLNSHPQPPEVMGLRVVAAYPQGSKDIESSTSRVPAITEKVKEHGVEIVPSIDALLDRVDVVLLESNDGRPHLEQLRPCLEAGKPTFVDKPISASLADAIQIFEEAEAARVPVFSSSSLRFAADSSAVRRKWLGKISQASTRSPASLEPSHPDLFWYGIHGVEALFTVMGPGCQSVQRDTTPDGRIRVTGDWGNGRIGVFEEAAAGKNRFGGTATTPEGEVAVGSFDGYEPLLHAVAAFFRNGIPPVEAAETLEIYAFMEAADESKRRQGAKVTLAEMMERARQQIAAQK